MGRRRVLLLLTTVIVVLCVSSAVALAATLIGTDASEVINGTNSADLINGKGGDDITAGKAGNDTYFYADNFGSDTVIEPKKVGRKSGGIDSLDFSRVSGAVTVASIPEWSLAGGGTFISCRNNNLASAASGGFLNLCYFASATATTPSASYIETITGSAAGNDFIVTGGLTNTLKPGDGNGDFLWDRGGYPGDANHPPLAASSDTFKGFTATTGAKVVEDDGGTADKLDLRPFESSDVYVDRSGDHLIIALSPTSTVTVVSHFFRNPNTGATPFLIENIIFADGTFSGASTGGSISSASTTTQPASTNTIDSLISASKERAETTSEGAELQKAAKKAAAEAEKAKKKIEKKLAEHRGEEEAPTTTSE